MMARSRQFIDGWRHAEKSLVAWRHNLSRCMGDPHAQALLNVTADDFGKWSKGRYRTNWRTDPVDPGDPLIVFQAAVRSEALEEAAKIAEALLGRLEDETEPDAQIRRIAKLIRAAKSAEPPIAS